jgi:DNA-binding helix-hairpin-helix protein with protein kinase domain
MLMADFFDSQGRPLALGKELGSGGEGAVFEIVGDPARVAKIYHRPISPEKAEKLRAMARLASEDLTTFASWPLAVLCNRHSDHVAGIMLPRVSGHGEIHNLYSPAHRKIVYPDKDWSFLVHVAMNCAAAFDAVHAKGHVIGDVNQGNLLVSKRGTVFLIDCDSFQVSAPGKVFLCDVGVPQYTPPELQGRNFRGLARTANHDRFGLALVIFHLLFMGRHPFAGRYQGRGDMPIEQAIADYRYVFSEHAASLGMARPPQTLAPECVAPELAPLFERAFGRGSEQPDVRPTAGQWHAALFTLAGKLEFCASDRGHRFPADLADCPWCRLMLEGAPNFFLSVTFRSATPEVLNVTAEVAALLRAVEQAPRPRAAAMPPPPDLSGIVPAPAPPAVQSAQSLATMVRYVAVGSLLASGGMLAYPEIGYISVPIFTVFALWWLALFLTSGHRPERHRRRKALRARRGELRQLQSAWHAGISTADTQFKAIQRELRAARGRIEGLKSEHDAELRKLGRDVWRRQRDAFLQRWFISDAKIDGVGPGRTATLASYGVETAADVEYNRVLGIPGIGPDVTNNLVAWRSALERGFTVNKAEGVPAAERQALLLKYAQFRQQLEIKLRGGPGKLRALEVELQRTLAELGPQIDRAYAALAQAHVDVEAMKPPSLRRFS